MLFRSYSRRFKTEVPYCSDSNGYWRFRRLRDVLASGSDVCLQVLTHPGWWMDVPMPPRHRVFRSAFGRAHAAISLYDSAIAAHGRENFAGRADALKILRGVPAGRYALLDFLWMTGEMATLYLELWRLHESQVSGLCRAALQKQWHVSAQELDNFFQNPNLNIDATRMFTELFGCSFHEVARVGVDSYLECARLCKTLLRGRGAATTQQLEDGCVALCRIIAALAAWGTAQPIGYDGLADLDTVNVSHCDTANVPYTNRANDLGNTSVNCDTMTWEQFKAAQTQDGTSRAVV